MARLFFIFSFLCGTTIAQSLDSLLLFLNTAGADTNKVILLNKISSKFRNSGNYDSAYAYAEHALRLSDHLDFNRGRVMSNVYIALSHKDRGEYPRALEYYNTAVKIAIEANDTRGVTFCYDGIGLVYQHQGKFVEAIDIHLKALKIREKENDLRGISKVYNNLGSVYNEQKNFEEALKNHFAALEIKKKLGDKKEMASSYNNIAGVFYNQGKLEEALESQHLALKLEEETGDVKGIASSFGNIGTIYTEQKKFDDALAYHLRSLEIKKEIGFRLGIRASYENIGNLHYQMKNYKAAEESFKNAFTLAMELNELEGISTSAQRLSELYDETDRPQLALEFYKKHIAYRDSIVNEENTRRAVQLEMNYEFDKKETAMKEEQKKRDAIAAEREKVRNLQLAGLAVFVVIVITGGLLLFRQNKIRSEQRALQMEQQLLRSQMNPHFIFNSLTAIESFIYEKQPKEAGRYLSDFARLMRLILENSSEEYITVAKELMTLKYYLELQKLRMNNQLNYSIEVDPLLEVEEICIPPILTQPFIENAIEHGIRGNTKNGFIAISFLLKKDVLIITVTDNGVGIKKGLELQKSDPGHRSFAIKITKDRLNFLNRQKKRKLAFSVTDLSLENPAKNGTQVKFSIPV